MLSEKIRQLTAFWSIFSLASRQKVENHLADESCRASQVLVGLRLQLPDSHLLGPSMLDVQKWLPPLHLGKEVE